MTSVYQARPYIPHSFGQADRDNGRVPNRWTLACSQMRAAALLLCAWSDLGQATHVGTRFRTGLYADSSCSNLLLYGLESSDNTRIYKITTEDGCTEIADQIEGEDQVLGHWMRDCENQLEYIYGPTDTTCSGSTLYQESMGGNYDDNYIQEYQIWDLGGCNAVSDGQDEYFLQLIDETDNPLTVMGGMKYVCAADGQLGEALLAGDPHLRGAHGDRADVRGVHHAVYAALSARNISLGVNAHLKLAQSLPYAPLSPYASCAPLRARRAVLR